MTMQSLSYKAKEKLVDDLIKENKGSTIRVYLDTVHEIEMIMNSKNPICSKCLCIKSKDCDICNGYC